MIRLGIIAIACLLWSNQIFAQRQVVAPQQMREADAHYAKRTWRIIDLNER